MRVLREVRDAIGSFLGGQEHGICVLYGEREHLPFVYRILQEFEAASADVFLPFVHRCDALDDYLGVIAERVEASAREARGDPSWVLPEPCRDPGTQAELRLREILTCARAMLPPGRVHPRLVVVLCPLEVTDEEGYSALVRSLALRAEGTPPWFRRMRVFVHARSVEGWTLPARVLGVKVDLSPDALATSAALDAEDPSLSQEERAQALLQAAMIDAGHHRFEAARARLDVVFGEAKELKNPVLAALALSGLGDVERLAGDAPAAIGWYERALVPAGEAGSPVILLMVSRHLADLYLAAERASDAEIFYDGAQRLAAAIAEPETQVSSLVGRGLAQQRRGAGPSEWAASFVEAGEVARRSEREDLLEGVRPRLVTCRGRALPAELRGSLEGLLGGAG